MNQWLYQGCPPSQEILDKSQGFVYTITNTLTGKKYIGKKRLNFYKTKKLKSKKRKIKIVKESDWKDYWGSSKELLADIETYGKDKFNRDIFRFCKSKGECSYWELYLQMMHHVLLYPDLYYNNYVGARIHRKHVYKKEEK